MNEKFNKKKNHDSVRVFAPHSLASHLSMQNQHKMKCHFFHFTHFQPSVTFDIWQSEATRCEAIMVYFPPYLNTKWMKWIKLYRSRELSPPPPSNVVIVKIFSSDFHYGLTGPVAREPLALFHRLAWIPFNSVFHTTVVLKCYCYVHRMML